MSFIAILTTLRLVERGFLHMTTARANSSIPYPFQEFQTVIATPLV